MIAFQNSRYAASPAPAPPIRISSTPFCLDAPKSQATRQIRDTPPASARHSVNLRITLLIDAKNFRNHRNHLKTNHSPHF